jgi:hypothetical protein
VPPVVGEPAEGSAEARAADPPPAAAALPRPGERLQFAVALAGLPVGRAELATARLTDGWQLELSGATNAIVDFFCAVRGFASARLDDDLTSRNFALWLDEDGERSARSLAFDEVPTLWYRAPGENGWMAELTQYRSPQDPLALLQRLRALDPADAARDYEVAMTLRSFCYRVRFLGREDLEIGVGSFEQALRWRVDVHPYEQLGDEPKLGPLLGFYEVAISSDARRLPLKVSREFGFGQVALELTGATLAAVSGPRAGAGARE